MFLLSFIQNYRLTSVHTVTRVTQAKKKEPFVNKVFRYAIQVSLQQCSWADIVC